MMEVPYFWRVCWITGDSFLLENLDKVKFELRKLSTNEYMYALLQVQQHDSMAANAPVMSHTSQLAEGNWKRRSSWEESMS